MAKLINIDEEIPSEFFIFVNKLNPMTYHNFNLIGQFNSGAFATASFGPEYLQKYLRGSFRYLPYEPVPMDAVALSPYFLTAINDYRIEYDAEAYRERYFPLYPSRLSAIYAFGDAVTCAEVSRKHGWPLAEVHRFELVDNPLNRVAKANMEIVSLARHAFKVSAFQDSELLWASYWSSTGNITLELPTPDCQRRECDSGIIWEYLIEGTVRRMP